MDIEYEPLDSEDVADAAELSAAAGWGARMEDWERLLNLSEIRTVGGWIDDTLISTASVVTYDESVAWIGSIIVAAPYRRRGLGTEIFDRALQIAERTGVSIIGLDANDAGKPIYERAGFVDVLTDFVFTGVPQLSADTSGVEAFEAVERVADYDAERVGVDRRFLLETILADPHTHGLLASDHAGYAVYGRTRDGWRVGPLVADDPTTVRHLLAAITDAVDDEPVTLNTVGDDQADMFSELGLSQTRTLTRMTYRSAQRILSGPAVYANAGFVNG